MFDNIKNFFQQMYDSTIGEVVNWISDFYLWVSSAYDLGLVLVLVVLSFFIFRLLKYVTVPAIILSQIVMLTGIITAMLSFIALLSTSLVSIYNRIFSLAEYIGSSASGISCFGSMINCLGISGLISTYFTELFALFIVALLIRISGIFFWASSIISDKLWRIGVLMGLV